MSKWFLIWGVTNYFLTGMTLQVHPQQFTWHLKIHPFRTGESSSNQTSMTLGSMLIFRGVTGMILQVPSPFLFFWT